MPVNWKSPDAFTRLLAAMVAAQDMKLDYRRIATMYGNGATYDAIEGRFRIIKKEAAALKAEIDSGERSEAPARGAPPSASANVTPTKKPRSGMTTTSTPSRDRTKGGRVGKSNGTPSKKRTGVKVEQSMSSASGNNSFVELPGEENDDVLWAAATTTTQRNNGAHHGGAGGGAAVVGEDENELGLYYEDAMVDAESGMDVEAF